MKWIRQIKLKISGGERSGIKGDQRMKGKKKGKLRWVIR